MKSLVALLCCALALALLPATAFAHGVPGPATINVSNAAPSPTPGPGPAPGPGGRTGAAPKGGFTGQRLGKSSTTGCPARQIRTTIDWMGTLPPRSESFGYAASTLPLKALLSKPHAPKGTRSDLPSIVYFADASDDEALLRFERNAFLDERVGVASHFFNCFRIGYEDLNAAEKKLYGDGSEGPRVVVMAANGKILRTFKGPHLTATKLSKTMSAVVKKHYKRSLTTVLAREGKVLDELDRTYYETKVLEAQRKVVEERLAEKECASCRKVLGKLERKLAETRKEREAALASERKILGKGVAERF
jgi:hypothetical protein